MARRAAHVTISGRVQGVGYRAWTELTARGFGLDGWARNRRNGDVEAVFVGPEDRVEAMIAACRQGPPMARVLDVKVGTVADEGAAGRFEIRPTV